MATPTNLPAAFVANTVLTATQQNDLRGAFRVLQVVTGSTSTTTTNNTSTLADTGLSVTITPQSNTSKILVLLAQNGCLKNTGSALNALQLLLFRNATQIAEVAHFAGYTGTNIVNIVGTIGSTILDAPATTSALTYKTQFCNAGINGVGVSVNDTSLSTISVCEISA